MSFFTYIAFPRELKAFRLRDIKGREKEYGINYDTNNYREDIVLFPNASPEESSIAISDKKDATFKDCFKNTYIYKLGIDTCCNEQLSDTLKKIYELEAEEKSTKLKLLYDQILSDFIVQNINLGEFVEMYSEFVNHIDFNLGSPVFEYEVELKDLSILESRKNTTDSYKITIFYNIPF